MIRLVDFSVLLSWDVWSYKSIGRPQLMCQLSMEHLLIDRSIDTAWIRYGLRDRDPGWDSRDSAGNDFVVLAVWLGAGGGGAWGLGSFFNRSCKGVSWVHFPRTVHLQAYKTDNCTINCRPKYFHN